jgi:hypothetical protein
MDEDREELEELEELDEDVELIAELREETVSCLHNIIANISEFKDDGVYSELIDTLNTCIMLTQKSPSKEIN